MRVTPFFCAAIIGAMMPTVALADDPNDAAMRNAAARVHDREMTRQLNREEGARVRQRDARSTPRWRVAGDDEHLARSRDHERAMADYARNRARYEQDMLRWRRAVAACRAGDYFACDN